MLKDLLVNEGGFVVSAELVLVATIVVLGVIVGLSEVQHAVNAELNDVGDAIGSLNQSYYFSGFSKRDRWIGWGLHAFTNGSYFTDVADACDYNQCDIACDSPVQEGPKRGGASCDRIYSGGACDQVSGGGTVHGHAPAGFHGEIQHRHGQHGEEHAAPAHPQPEATESIAPPQL